MKLKNIFLFLIPFSFIGLGFYFKYNKSANGSLLPLIIESVKAYHFNPTKIDDKFSTKAFDAFIKMLDANKRIFTETDLAKLSKYKNKIDDMAMSGDFTFFDEVMKIYDSRLKLIESHYKTILNSPFDYNINETINLDEKQKYPKDENELKERWRKFLKYSALSRYASAIETQDNIAKQKDTIVKILSKDTLEYQARKGVLKVQDDWIKRWAKIKLEDKKSYYINSILSVFDPHTNYFPPADKKSFDINMSGQLEGIGASLQEKDGYIKVARIVPGSPSALQGELKEGDLILKVAQGNAEPVDIVNADIDDAVKLIRGPKGTEVRLTVKKIDGSIKVIKIIRDVVVLDETFAKSVILEDQDHKKVGFIYLPSFYTDMNGFGGRTCWTDVRNEIRKLKEEGISSLVIDLRNNGGGSLQDVVYMSGLFIDKGPIVQVKSRNAKPEVLLDREGGTEWDGPLVLMVNNYSASASEILAAAMQDYNRAVIVGSNSTFGKGSVQRFIDLNEIVRNETSDDFGSVKLTIQKFYRINGGSTQLKGVVPHIILPDNIMYLKNGEAEQDNPMAWDKIAAANYNTTGHLKNLANIIKNSNARIAANSIFKTINTQAIKVKKYDDQIYFPLHIAKYQADEKTRKEELKANESAMKENESLQVTTLSKDLEEQNKDKAKADRAKEWIKSIKKDPYIFEVLQIAEDLLK